MEEFKLFIQAAKFNCVQSLSLKLNHLIKDSQEGNSSNDDFRQVLFATRVKLVPERSNVTE